MRMRIKKFSKPIITCVFLVLPLQVHAWGVQGHRVIGRAAASQLDATAALELRAILDVNEGTHLDDAIDEACNWPDRVRKKFGWKWSQPLHYVNLPRHSSRYERSRDCPEGLCVTEGIVKYANALSQPLQDERRWQAFAFLCHLVADLHQPLHAGYRDDRGGNNVDIEYQDKEWNLHQFWDSVLIEERMKDENAMITRLKQHRQATTIDWSVGEPTSWTEQSHRIAGESAYPAGRQIDQAFADQSWEITVQQLERASSRLARVLNAVIGAGSVAD